jgi:hypothetical protein
MFTPISFWNFTDLTPPEPGLTYGRFVAVRRSTGTNQRAAWSNDGITWNVATTPNSLNYYSIDFSPEQGLYVATSVDTNASNIMTSTNSVTWTSRSKPNTNALSSVTWCGAWNKWLAVGLTNVYESSDGSTWTIAYTHSRTSATFENSFANTPSGWVFATGIVTSGVNYILVSTDGISFTESNMNTSLWGSNDTKWIAYNSDLNRYIATSFQGDYIYESSTASSGWTGYFDNSSITANTLNKGYRIGGAVGNGLFVSCLFSGANGANAIKYSSTGLTGSWTYSTITNQRQDLYDVEWAPEISTFFCCRTTGNGYSSNNGITWTQRTLGNEYVHVSWGAGVRTNGYKQGAGIT